MIWRASSSSIYTPAAIWYCRCTPQLILEASANRRRAGGSIWRGTLDAHLSCCHQLIHCKHSSGRSTGVEGSSVASQEWFVRLSYAFCFSHYYFHPVVLNLFFSTPCSHPLFISVVILFIPTVMTSILPASFSMTSFSKSVFFVHYVILCFQFVSCFHYFLLPFFLAVII